MKVAIVGLGFVGKIHLEAYQEMSDLEVTAVCDARFDTDPDALRATLGNLQSTTADLDALNQFGDLQEMLSAGGFDVVDICLPTFLHREAAEAAFAGGYHVFLEKPIALTVEDAVAIQSAADRSGLKLCVAHCLRYWPSYAELARIIRSGELGELRSALFERYGSSPAWSWENWYASEKLSGGMILDLHIHDTDFIHWALGPPESVVTTCSGESGSVGSKVQTLYSYPNATVCATAGAAHAPSFPFTQKAICMFERGVVELDQSKDPALVVYDADGGVSSPTLDSRNGYQLELADFVRHVVDGTETLVSPQSAITTLAIVLAEKRSALEKVPVKISKEIG